MTTPKRKRKPVLPILGDLVFCPSIPGWRPVGAVLDEYRAAERVIRAARRYVAAHPDGYGLRRAVAAFDNLTGRRPTRRTP